MSSYKLNMIFTRYFADTEGQPSPYRRSEKERCQDLHWHPDVPEICNDQLEPQFFLNSTHKVLVSLLSSLLATVVSQGCFSASTTVTLSATSERGITATF